MSDGLKRAGLATLYPSGQGVVTGFLFVKLLSKNGRDALHWSRRQKLKNEYLLELSHAYPRKGVYTSEVKQRVTFTRVLGKGEKLFDDANMAGGSCVELQDAMTALGWWHDDSPRYLESRFAQDAKHRQYGSCVVIRIELLEALP